MVRGMATLLGFQLVGELIARLGHLPISGPICGMAALLAWLHLRGEVKSELGKVCDGILANMAILFVPVGVGAMSYSGLLGRVEDLIGGKRLIIVPSGPLTVIPFQALVTQEPASALVRDPRDYMGTAWLGKRHAVTVLPSVASLRALRQFAKESRAKNPFIGFGNPLLTGPSDTDKTAWARQSCSKSLPSSVQGASRGVRGPIPKFFRSGHANVDEVRTQYPLPETADELCAVAQTVGAQESAVHLGERNTEKVIKARRQWTKSREAGRLRCGGLYEGLIGRGTLMRTEGTSREEVDGAFKRVMPWPFWNQWARAQPERAGTDLE